MFLDIRSARTVANLAERPTVQVNVVDPLARRWYGFKGRAEVLAGPAVRGSGYPTDEEAD